MKVTEVMHNQWLLAGGLLALCGAAHATAVGSDSNLGYKAAAGGMGGAAYTMPQEASAAVFGNPASLAGFRGRNVNVGASYLGTSSKNTQSSAAGTNISASGTNDYILPDVGMAIELSPKGVLGLGIEVDAGLGADFRAQPVSLIGVAGAASLPLVVELVSFNANLAYAHRVTPQLSVGAALTAGFGLGQLGTAGPSIGIPLGDFGGTTSSTHAFGGGFSVGATYALGGNLTAGAAYKSKVRYEFENIVHTSVAGIGYQNLTIEQPEEVILGLASAGNHSPWLLEADLVWKGWSRASTYRDVWRDQWLLALGAQYTTGPWKLRAGYHYSSDILRKTPNNTFGGLQGVGTFPLGTAAEAGGLGEVARDVVRIVQTTLVPVVMKHTVSSGLGYQFDKSMRVDVYGAYAMRDSIERTDGTAAAALSAPVARFKGEAKMWAIGVGASFSF